MGRLRKKPSVNPYSLIDAYGNKPGEEGYDASTIGTAEEQFDTNADEGVTLSIETADDVTPQEPKTVSDKAKAFVKGLFNEDDSTSVKKGRGRTSTKKGKIFQNHLNLFVNGFIMVMSWLFPDLNQTFEVNGETYSLMPSNEQSEKIIAPLLSILDRHTKIEGLNPDVEDLLASLGGAASYGFTLKANLLLLHLVKENQKNEKPDTQNREFPHSFQTTPFGGNIAPYN
jgi:hypothetical protein